MVDPRVGSLRRGRGRLRSLLELTRPPNLLTAAADVLAGLGIAGLGHAGALVWLLPATVCLYAGGVTLNDRLDAAVDRRERPERPIPSGRVTPTAATVQALALLAAGVALARLASPLAGAIAALIAAAAILYDARAKHHGLAGPLCMGTCRGLNLLLGLSAAPGVLASRWFVGLIPLTYVAAITAASRAEVGGGSRRLLAAVLALLAAAGLGLAALAVLDPPWSLAVLPFLLLVAWRVLPSFREAYRRPDAGTIRQAVRSGILGLVPLDATIAAAGSGPLYALLVLALVLPAGRLAAAFSPT